MFSTHYSVDSVLLRTRFIGIYPEQSICGILCMHMIVCIITASIVVTLQIIKLIL